MPEMVSIQSRLSYRAITQTSLRTHLLPWRLPIVVLLLTVTRSVGLNRQSLWFDEGYTLSVATTATFHDFLHIFPTLTTSEHLQPLYYLFIFLWSRIGGTADIALRLPSVVFSAISGLIVYAFADNLPGRQATQSAFPLLAVTFYASSSFALYYAQEARPYALVQMLSFLVLALWNRDRQSKPSGSIAFAIVCLLSAITSPFALLLVFSLSSMDLIFDRKCWFRRWRWSILLIGATLIFYIVICRNMFSSYTADDVVCVRQPLWMNAAYLIYGIFFGTTLGPPSSALRNPEKLHTLMAYWPTLAVCAISILALSRGVYLSLRTRSRSMSLSCELALAIVLYASLLFFIFGFAGHLNLLPRHASALFAMMFLFSTSCASTLSRHFQSNNIYLTSGLTGLLALNLLSMWNYWGNSSFRKDDYRAAANILRQSERRTGLAYLVAGDAFLFQHYGVSLIDISNVNPTVVRESLRRSSRDALEITLVINEHRNFRWDNTSDPIKVLQPTYQCIINKSLASIQILSCRLNSDGSNLTAVVHAKMATGAYAR